MRATTATGRQLDRLPREACFGARCLREGGSGRHGEVRLHRRCTQPSTAAHRTAGDGKDRAGTPLFTFGDSYDWRKEMGISNRLTAYLYLIDSSRRVRWEACGPASPQEVGDLIRCGERAATSARKAASF